MSALITLDLTDDVVERIAAAVIAQLRPAVEPFNCLTPEQTCELLQVSRDTLAEWDREGKLVPFRDGARMVRYDIRDIDRFVTERKSVTA